jgi:hypothetical protein
MLVASTYRKIASDELQEAILGFGRDNAMVMSVSSVVGCGLRVL